jgi:hypothetical protein
MKSEEQIKALAELDGCSEPWLHMNGLWNYTNSDGKTILVRPYLTSYDAIIPVIQKQGNEIAKALVLEIVDGSELADYTGLRLFHSSPTELCEALLRATGKWKD